MLKYFKAVLKAFNCIIKLIIKFAIILFISGFKIIKYYN